MPLRSLKESFGGSGYDIAAAQYNTPIFYTLKDNMPQVQACTLTWGFTEHLFFVHLNQKQESKQAINTYKKLQKDPRILEENYRFKQKNTCLLHP